MKKKKKRNEREPFDIDTISRIITMKIVDKPTLNRYTYVLDTTEMTYSITKNDKPFSEGHLCEPPSSVEYLLNLINLELYNV